MADVDIRGLRKNFGNIAVLRDIDLSVASGSLVAILGPSGSGKTTLLRLLCGFERGDGGSIRINGQEVSGPGIFVPPEQRRIGYVAQEGALFPHLSVAENIVFGLPRALRKTRHRVDELLELVGLPADFAGRSPHSLSGGQQQRIALARALAPAPTLVLLDEPFSSLDAGLRVETRQAVAQALSAAGATALLVTHDQSEALSMGNEVAVLWSGELVQVASPEQLYRMPVTPELARFVGDAMLLPGRVEGTQVVFALGTSPLMAPMPAGPVQVLLRPEQVRIGTVEEGANTVTARVVKVDYYGHDACVHLDLLEVLSTALIARLPGHACPQVGEVVGVRVEGAVVGYEDRVRPAS
ncbi:ABC transporter ATP-binding protein [Pseudomonas sp. dw_358]|uniref:ABC transporter ATP-binding protein n=1 Tax=Pseudomonas sp. dw_358 TaxID=2720083 RepID=UPI001BD28E5D|nr:ABC transporter ATP-binding protein [Pseudomonas sp. dw_358]